MFDDNTPARIQPSPCASVGRGVGSVSECDHDTFRKEVDLNAARVYVQGLICIDISYLVDATLTEFVECLTKGEDKLRSRWEERGRTLGGSATHALRSAGAKGVQLYLGAALPRTLPTDVMRLIDEYGVNTQYVTRTDAPISQSMKLQFSDGKHLLMVSSAPGAYDLIPPRDFFDVMLVNPGSRVSRRSVLAALSDSVSNLRQPTTIGLIARGDWDDRDFRLVDRFRSRVFFNESELRSISKRLFNSAADARSNLQGLAGASSHSTTLVATLGGDGSMTTNGGNWITRATSAKVDTSCLVGAGDSFMTTVCLSAATGATENQSNLRGNMEAARIVSGCGPARTLEQLDRQIADHPEMVAEQLPVSA